MARSTVVRNFPRPRTACRDTNPSAHAPGSNDSPRERRRNHRPCADKQHQRDAPSLALPQAPRSNANVPTALWRQGPASPSHRDPPQPKAQVHHARQHHPSTRPRPASTTPPITPPKERRVDAASTEQQRSARNQAVRPGFVQDGGRRQEVPGPRQRVDRRALRSEQRVAMGPDKGREGVEGGWGFSELGRPFPIFP